MERTQIYLSKSQVKKLKELAQKKKTTFSGLVRDAVDVQYGVEQPAKWTKKEETLLDIAARVNALGEKGPGDLATNLDEYLYGGKK
ncbi:MAG TPA: CopG family transcriptional regulator [Candidatus Paceibacterota bacterium]|nr:CopG family transcriptional regulator [Candidatus Paceibacterota bacterium]